MQQQIGFLAIMVVVFVGSACTPMPLKGPTTANTVHHKDNIVVGLPRHDPYQTDQAKLHYLGVGGFAITVGKQTILTAPSYTNPSLWRNVPFVSMESDHNAIDDLFPEELRDENIADPEQQVKAILVGHSHYDHLLDVPYLMKCYLKTAKAYGSETTAAILDSHKITSKNEKSRVVAVNSSANSHQWVEVNERLRIFPIASSHAPHFMGITVQTGHYERGELKDPPRTAWGWKMGNVYAYVVDFLDEDKNVVFRLYYQDTASKPDMGLVPREVTRDGRPIDVAILTLAGYSNAGNYPKSIVRNTSANLYVVAHWEDFFSSRGTAPMVVRGTDESGFFTLLEHVMPDRSQWVMPSPGRKIVIHRKEKKASDTVLSP